MLVENIRLNDISLFQKAAHYDSTWNVQNKQIYRDRK